MGQKKPSGGRKGAEESGKYSRKWKIWVSRHAFMYPLAPLILSQYMREWKGGSETPSKASTWAQTTINLAPSAFSHALQSNLVMTSATSDTILSWTGKGKRRGSSGCQYEKLVKSNKTPT